MGTTAEKLQAILDSKADIKDAIESKGVTVGDATLAEYAGKIGEIQQGGGEEEDYHGDVIFIDYDGTVLYRYTKAEFLALSEMPANPEKEGFTAQGWNWTLADAKDYVTECGMLVIGQMRVTSDDKTRIYIALDDPNYLSPSVYIAANNSIDWGDGTVESTGNAWATITHTYSATGNYTIVTSFSGAYINPVNANEQLIYYKTVRKIHLGSITAFATYRYLDYLHLEEINIPNGLTSFSSGGAFNSCISLKAVVLPSTVTTLGNFTFVSCTNLKIISFNKNCTFGSNDYGYCFSLRRLCFPYVTSIEGIPNYTKIKTVVMPDTVTTIGSNFQKCVNLEFVLLSKNITTIPSSLVDSCLSLNNLILPNEVTTLKTRALTNCYLVSITVPSKVTSIESLAFYNCKYLRTIHMLPTTPPTAAGSNIFQQSPIEKIYVPQGSLTAYQTATNWSAYASYMEEEPAT